MILGWAVLWVGGCVANTKSCGDETSMDACAKISKIEGYELLR
mgnify:FL=1